MNKLKVGTTFVIAVLAVAFGPGRGPKPLKTTTGLIDQVPRPKTLYVDRKDKDYEFVLNPQVIKSAMPSVRSKGRFEIDGQVPEAIAGAQKIEPTADTDGPLVLTVVLDRTNQKAFEDFLDEVQQPSSPLYRQYLTPREQADRFGPSRQAFDEVREWLQRQGFRVVEGSANRLTLTVSGTRREAEDAFGLRIHNYRMGDREFYANDANPTLPDEIGQYVQAVIGLSSLGRPRPSNALAGEFKKAICSNAAKQEAQRFVEDIMTSPGNTAMKADGRDALYKRFYEQIYNSCLTKGYLGANGPNGLAQPESLARTLSATFPSNVRGAAVRWLDVDGTGQTVGLLQFDTFNINDIKDYLAFTGKPPDSINRLSQVHVNGGATLGAEEAEVLIDIIAVMNNAPGANVVVYDAPFSSIKTSFQAIFNRMIGDGVTVISNSWVYCEDQATLADVQSIDSVLASAAAAGITVLNATGDFGSTCVNGSANTISVPANSPHATAVGGTSLTLGPARTYASELFWDGSSGIPPTGRGGFGVSRFFSRPAYQNGFTNSPMRSVPDVSVNGDPLKGIEICQASAGGCPTGALYGGTSLGAPVWAAFIALLNQAQGQNLGELNPLLYPLGNTSSFHSPASMSSDFRHVGLGSPNLNLIHRQLAVKTAGPVSPSISEVTADPVVIWPDGTKRSVAVADGTSEAFIVVKLKDADGHTVSGKTVTLAMNAGAQATITPLSGVTNVANGAAIFSVRNSTPEVVTITATDTTDNLVLPQQVAVSFSIRPATAGSITASPTNVLANGADMTTITVTLQDANGNPSPSKLVNLFQGNGSSIISAGTGTTDATGKVQFTATNNVNEVVTYTAVDVTDRNLPVPGSAAVTFFNASGFCANFGHYGIGTAAPGYAVNTFASSFPNDCFTNRGPYGVAFDQNGTLFVGDIQNSVLYAFGQEGGVAGPATQVGTVQAGGSLTGLAFTKDGKLYGVLSAVNKVVEINPLTAAVIRTVADISGANPLDVAVDPLSGDLFVSSFDGVKRISNFSNGPGTVTPYFSGGVDGITFASDGTLYGAGVDRIVRAAGTNTATPGSLTTAAFLPSGDGVAIEANPANPAKPFLYVNRVDGIITRIDTSALPDSPPNPCGAACVDIYTGGSRGDFVTVSASGCLYATQSDRVIRLTKADGSCSLAPTNPAPQIALTPDNVQPSPAQGTNVSFTVQVSKVASAADLPIILSVSGPNGRANLVRTDANGKAVFSYAGVMSGTDEIFASAQIGGNTIFSHVAKVTWTAGKHSTFLTLNQSPSSGVSNQPLMVTASLVDISVLPAAPVAGASVGFLVANQSCTATTNSSGIASCLVTPTAAPGSYSLNATFAATSALLASSASKTVSLLDAVAQPVVQFSAANYSVQEDCTTITVTVNRVGDSSAAVSVEYNTSDGSATERKDYITALGKLQFNPGETSRTFVVLINEDSFVEGTETLTINLGAPSGVALGAQAVATITINDDSAEPATNIIDEARNYVCQNYHDFLNRQPDQNGWDFWTNQITSCGADTQCVEVRRINASAAFFLSIEFQQTGYLIQRLYKAAYGDAAGNSALGGTHQIAVPTVRFTEFLADTQKIGDGVIVLQPGWEQILESNKQAFVLAFVQRSRFTAAFPNSLTPAQFVDALNSKAGNVLSPGERTTAIALFGSAADSSNLNARALALRQVAEDQDLYDAEFNRAFVLMQYLGYLRRNPNDPQDSDYTGYDFWLTKLNQFNGNYINAEMVKAFLSSIEYRQRFGP